MDSRTIVTTVRILLTIRLIIYFLRPLLDWASTAISPEGTGAPPPALSNRWTLPLIRSTALR